ncbi:hypothetical protein E2C01_006316 [Portunus trituberculatus]|uniref:HTH psq-type domain-containing protein n=1 Tax=Portunus trituberculatus TaxID=210409 RepID=A0A5B7CWJ7_PORTR|nr:hypothetical protein [Portunus trituberculatus]
MPPKCPAMSPSIAKTMKSLTLEVKLDIIHRHERGKKSNSITRHHLDSINCLYYFQDARAPPNKFRLGSRPHCP